MDTDTTALFDLDVLEATYGPTARDEFARSPIDKQDLLWKWAFETLPSLSEPDFVRQTSHAIFDAATVSRFPGFFDLHFKTTVAYRESERRHTAAHPAEDCNATRLYERAYNSAVRDAGHAHMAAEPRPCTCPTDTD